MHCIIIQHTVLSVIAFLFWFPSIPTHIAYPEAKNESCHQRRVEVKQGDSVVLDCNMQISALSNLKVEWYMSPNLTFFDHCSRKRQPALHNYSLVLTNVNSHDTGLYTCVGTANHNTYLPYDLDKIKMESKIQLDVVEFSELL